MWVTYRQRRWTPEHCLHPNVQENPKQSVPLFIHYGPYDPTTATATWDFFTSGCVLRMSRFLRRQCPFPHGRREALFDVVRKRGINQTEAWQRNQGKNETLRLNLKKISLYDMSETNRAWSLLYTTTNWMERDSIYFALFLSFCDCTSLALVELS